VGDARRDGQRRVVFFGELDGGCEHVGGRAGAEVAEADLSAAAEDSEVVVMAEVYVDAAKDSWL
jgi:hypothetical protein